MTRLSWLHLSDLHRGLADHDHLWQDVENDFYDDLERLHRECGPWDLVLFTGDLTQRGSPGEFASLNRILQTLEARLADLGSRPILLAVPGNHDLMRPADPTEPAAEVLSQWGHHKRAQRIFWSQPESAYRKVVSDAFAAYEAWWNDPARPFRRPAPAAHHAGLLPGDHSTVIEKDGLRLGIVGLNSAFLQLEGGEYKERLSLHTSQFSAACHGNGPTWAKSCDLCLLLTHHPSDWLDLPSRQQHYTSNIASFFAVHLHGHMHENKASVSLVPGGRLRYVSQGCSLFGLETLGDEGPTVRQHGYSAGRVEVERDHAELRIWPRCAVKTDGGPWQIVSDMRFGRLEADDGTHALPLELLRRPPVPKEPTRPPPAKPSTPRGPQPPGAAYDPAWYVSRGDREEQRVLENLENDGAPATIVWGPVQHGKTWFLRHIVRRAIELGPERMASFEVDVNKLPDHLLKRSDAEPGSDSDEDRAQERMRGAVKRDRAEFFRELGRLIASAAGHEAWVAEVWAGLPDNPSQALSVLLERHVLPAAPRTIIVLENVHLLRLCPFRDELFKLFRTWNQDASRDPWSRLRLLLGVSAGPELFAQDADVSGFLNSALDISIGGFKLPHARALCEKYHLTWTDEERTMLLDGVESHPYLVRLAMYECANGTTLTELFAPRHTANLKFFAAMRRYLRKPT
ncbi:MAG: AAA-like domain-containing protein [Byssovorax sp.]